MPWFWHQLFTCCSLQRKKGANDDEDKNGLTHNNQPTTQDSQQIKDSFEEVSQYNAISSIHL